MSELLNAAREQPNALNFAACISKRAWLKRGIQVAKLPESEVPASERPFREFFDTVHQKIIERMLVAAENRESTWTAYHTLLERMWREEYAKSENMAGISSGLVAIYIERPPKT